MIGAFIGDLAAWTWMNKHGDFYPYLVSDAAEKSIYTDIMLYTAQNLIENPKISREEFMHQYQIHFSPIFVKDSAVHDILHAIIIGWLYDDLEELSPAIHRYCICNDKEEVYASHFLAQLIFSLRHGSTKIDAAKVDFCGTFRSFTKEEHWKNGSGVLSYLVRAWMCFYDAFDYGSTIHNAVKRKGDAALNCILAGALADAMYGCDIYYVKKQFEGGRKIRHIGYIDKQIYNINRKNRHFFAKNNALTNVDRHIWSDAECQHSKKAIDKELRKRILFAFHTGWDDRYGFYLDNGWIYLYRSHILLSRFILEKQNDETYRIRSYQKSEQSQTYDLGNIALDNALYSVEYRWDLIKDKLT